MTTRRHSQATRRCGQSCANLYDAMPSPADYTQDERDHDQAVLEAARLAFVVHEYDREAVAAVVEHVRRAGRLEAVLIALGAMVDIDKPLHELVAWLNERHDTETVAATRKPWQRESYPVCLPELDGSPEGCLSRHGTPARHTAGCRGEGCVQARKDYDAFRYAQRRQESDDEARPDCDPGAVRAHGDGVSAVDDGARRSGICAGESRRPA